MSQWNDDDDLVAVRLLMNIHILLAHERPEDIARRTGIDLTRVREILAFTAYPDGYEIAVIQHAYRHDIWPGHDTGPHIPNRGA